MTSRVLINSNVANIEFRPNNVLKLILITLYTLILILTYQVIMNLVFPIISHRTYEITTIINICLAVDIAACLILKRHQMLLQQINVELEKREQAEQELHKANEELEKNVKERTAEIEGVNRNLRLEILERKRFEADLQRSEENYRMLVKRMPGTVFKGYVDWTVDFFDDKIEELTGYKREDFNAKRILWSDVILEEDLWDVKKQFRQALNTDKAYVREYRIKNKKGNPLWIQERGQILCDKEGRVEYVNGVFFDINNRKLAEEALKEANERLKSLLHISAQQNRNTTLLNEMSELLQTCQISAEAYDIIAGFAQKFYPKDSGILYVFNDSKNILESVVTWGESAPREKVILAEDCWALRRSRIYFMEEGSPGLLCKHASSIGYMCIPLIAQGEAIGMLHLTGNSKSETASSQPASDESKQQLAVSLADHIGLALANLKLRESLRTQAIRDPLTGLFNRRYMEETLERECARVKRLGSPIGIIMMDLDHFKQFNDTFGHSTGDLLLREFGSWLKTQRRVEDIACRFGGEEFLLILPGASPEVAIERAEHLRLGVKQLHTGQLHNSVSLSLGVAVFPDHGSNVEEIIKAADKAMYQAKNGGRDRVVIAQQMPGYASDYFDKIALATHGG